MTRDLGRDGTFRFFAFFALCSPLLTPWKVPGSKNRSLEDIENQSGAQQERSAANG